MFSDLSSSKDVSFFLSTYLGNEFPGFRSFSKVSLLPNLRISLLNSVSYQDYIIISGYLRSHNKSNLLTEKLHISKKHPWNLNGNCFMMNVGGKNYGRTHWKKGSSDSQFDPRRCSDDRNYVEN